MSNYLNKKYCFCQQCRFPYSHLTAYHKCGTCGNFGHGVNECEKNVDTHNKINELFEKYILTNKDYLPNELHCTNNKCKCKSTHTTGSHESFFELDEYADLSGPDKYGIRRRFAESKEKGIKLVSNNINSYARFYVGMGLEDVYYNINGNIGKKTFEYTSDFYDELKLFTKNLRELKNCDNW